MARSYSSLCRKAGLPEPTGFGNIPPAQVLPRTMFAVYRKDYPYTMAIFAVDSWARAWIATCSQPPENYEIREVLDPTKR